MFLTTARDGDLGSTARTSDDDRQITWITRTLMTPRRALVIFTSEWPVAYLITRRARAGATLNHVEKALISAQLDGQQEAIFNRLLFGCRGDGGSP